MSFSNFPFDDASASNKKPMMQNMKPSTYVDRASDNNLASTMHGSSMSR